MDHLDKSANALRYPDFHLWRDKSKIRNGYWPDGNVARISDPEFQPDMDELKSRLATDREYRDAFLKNVIIPD